MPILTPQITDLSLALLGIALLLSASWHMRTAIRTGRERIRFSAALRVRNANIFWFSIGSSIVALFLGACLLDRYVVLLTRS